MTTEMDGGMGTGFWAYARACLVIAWRDSISIANSWAPTLGVGVALFISDRLGFVVSFPSDLRGLLSAAVFSIGAAWLIVFLFRLIVWAPYLLYREQRQRADAATAASAAHADAVARTLLVNADLQEAVPHRIKLVINFSTTAPGLDVASIAMNAAFNGKQAVTKSGNPFRVRHTEEKSFAFEFDKDDIEIKHGKIALAVTAHYGPMDSAQTRKISKAIDVAYYVANFIVQDASVTVQSETDEAL